MFRRAGQKGEVVVVVVVYSLFVGFFAGLVGVALGLLGDPVAGVSEGVHVEGFCMWV